MNSTGGNVEPSGGHLNEIQRVHKGVGFRIYNWSNILDSILNIESHNPCLVFEDDFSIMGFRPSFIITCIPVPLSGHSKPIIGQKAERS